MPRPDPDGDRPHRATHPPLPPEQCPGRGYPRKDAQRDPKPYEKEADKAASDVQVRLH
jgi:hypothetical protein